MKLDQHYFHFVVLSNTGRFTLSDYWRHLGKTQTTKNPMKLYPGYEIEHRKLKREYPYAGGKLLKKISTSGHAPYFYDAFALRVKTNKDDYAILAFPFAALARHSVDHLIADMRIKKGIDYKRADIASLIQRGLTGIGGEHFRAGFVGLQVISRGDPNLSSVTLGGDSPLKSELYQDFLKKPIEQGKKFFPEYCVLACELQYMHSTDKQSIVSNHNLRSRVRMDIFGNFKFYVHKGGENIVLIPYLLRELDAMKCLTEVSINPLSRISNEEEL